MIRRRAKRSTEMGVAAGLAATPALDLQPMGDLQPIRSPDAGQDAGLAAIEAEFSISDADLDLLDLSAIAFDQQTSWLSATEMTLAEHRAILDDFMGRVNASWAERAQAPITLQPYFMIPERCWEGEHREVLIEVLGLAPTQAWNVLPLAGDTGTARAVGVVEHPGARALDNRNIAATLINEAIETMHATFERATFAGDGVDTAALDTARARTANDIMAIAPKMAENTIGTDAVNHARATFFAD